METRRSDMIGIRMVILPLDASLSGSIAKVTDGDGIEELSDLTAQVHPHFTGNAVILSGTLLARSVAYTEHQFERSLRGTDNVAESYLRGFPDQVIAAIGAALAAKHLRFFQLLKDLLQVPGTDLLTPGDVLDLGWETNRVKSDVEKSSDTVTAFGGKSHQIAPFLSV
jgi:hypothetical protein